MLTLLKVGPTLASPPSWSFLRSPELKLHCIVYGDPIQEWLNIVQAVVLFGHPDEWAGSFGFRKRDVPLLWACDSEYRCPELPEGIDGIVTERMAEWEAVLVIRASISSRKRIYYVERERDELLLKLKERRWVEHAKQILHEIKGLDDEAAYKFLRVQAMNERKRLIEVAQSIVNAYQLIRR